MRRRLFNILAAVSLVMCVATVALWVRSYHAYDRIDWQLGHTLAGFSSGGGQLSANWVPNLEVPGESGWISYDVDFDFHAWHLWSFALGSYTFWPGVQPLATNYQLTTPYWLPTTVFCIPALLAILRQRRRLVRRTLCTRCGYDLRASTDRCPECGTAMPARASEAV